MHFFCCKLLTKSSLYDIIVSRYFDIMISFMIGGGIMKQATKSDRTKQVQFRMPTVLHNQLRKLLIDENISMADLFNKAAEEYIKSKEKEKRK